MDIRTIQTFIRAAELGSFTKAANALGYVQSAVSMQIMQLEQELEFPLFDRIGKSVSLTALGKDFLRYAYEIVCTMEKASNLGKDIKNLHGTLRVGILESLLFSNMLQLIPKFRCTYKNVDMQLKMGQASELLQQLKQNQLDMVYLSTGPNTDSDLYCHYKRREQLIFVCSPLHSIAGKEKLSAAELFESDFIVTEHTGICYGRLQELAQRYMATLHTSVEVDSTIAIAELLQKNMAVAFLPEYSVRKQLEQGSLVRLDVDMEPQIYYSQILGHKSRWVSPYMVGLIEIIQKEYPEKVL